MQRRPSRAFDTRAARTLLTPIVAVVVLLSSTAHARDSGAARHSDGRVHVSYWEKWTGMEKAAMEAVVQDFNRSQSKIWVDYQSVSLYQQKTLIAIAGGDPPDVAGLLAADIVDFADKNALVPLDDFARGTDLNRERYLPTFWDMGFYRARLWAAVSVPIVVGLHWNKDLFERAGLDPERPPRTIAELDDFAKKLTVVKDGNIEQLGFVPADTNWWPYAWGFWFGARLWDGGDTITTDSPENVRAFSWFQSYARTYGVERIQNFTMPSSGRVNFASAQNPFLAGKLAMVLQGVWMGNFIQKFSPSMRWGAAPFPSEHPGGPPVAIADADMLVIPNGARHPREAFAFIQYLSGREPMEKVCLGQRKISPLREVSARFFAEHKNPYIRMFQDLAASAGATAQPKMSIWHEYVLEIRNASERLWLGETTTERALGDVRQTIQKSWNRERERQRTEPSRWLSVLPPTLIVLSVGAVFVAARRERRSSISAARQARSNASLWKGLAFFSPWGIGLLVFTAFPVMSSVVYSFCDYSVLTPPKWIGLANYADLFADRVFWVALRNTLIYVALALPLGLLVALFFALLLDSNVRGTSLYRTLIFLPALMPVVAAAIIWLWMLNGDYGVINHVFYALTFGWFPKISWLTERSTALPSLVLVSVWGVGQTVVTLLVAMRDVPSSVYEAADIDGATFWHKVRHVTIPMISPVIYFNAILGIIGALQVFATPYIMTAGGPARATLFYTQRLYENAFFFLRMGYACAMAWILFLVVLGLTALAHRIGRSRVYYTGA